MFGPRAVQDLSCFPMFRDGMWRGLAPCLSMLIHASNFTTPPKTYTQSGDFQILPGDSDHEADEETRSTGGNPEGRPLA